MRAARLPHAGEDADSRRRHSFRQAAGRPHRSRGGLAAAGGRRPRLARKLRPARPGDCDAVILSDYGSGLVTPALAATVRSEMSKRSRRRPVPVLVDSRYRLLDYRGLTTCTPNESEVEQALGIHIDDDAGALERAGRPLLRRTRMQAVLITRGSRGMALFQPRQPTIHIPIFGSDEVADVTGAGDTVIATFGAGAGGRRVVLRSRAAGQLRGRPRGDEAGHRDRVGPRARRTPSRAITTRRPRTGRRKGRGTRSAKAGKRGKGDRCSAKQLIATKPADRGARADRAAGKTDRLRERLLRSPARRARCAICKARPPRPIGSSSP